MASLKIIYPIPLPQARQEMDFLDSSFFQSKNPDQRLPTPAEVRALSKSKKFPRGTVIFEDLNLLVKYEHNLNLAEAQCLWFVRRVLGDKVPVPEVYGWRVDGQEVFIYMQFVRGVTLEARWKSLSASEKTEICLQLCGMIGSLRQLKQDPSDQFIGSVDRQTPQDRVFYCIPKDGPFPGIKVFNDWFTGLPQRHLPKSKKYKDPLRSWIPDDGEICFTHADLHPSNIMISESGPPQVLAIVDWGQSGWYPDYWEYCKASYTCIDTGEWRKQWIPMFLAPRLDEEVAFAEFTISFGAL